jgi:hypothetical protein
MNDLARTTPIDLRAPGAQPYQRAIAAVEATDKWLDAARPIIKAYFALDDLSNDLRFTRGLDKPGDYDSRIGREASSYVHDAAENLREMLDGIRSDFIADAIHPYPASDASEAEHDAYAEFEIYVTDETLSVANAIKRVEAEVWDAFVNGKALS